MRDSISRTTIRVGDSHVSGLWERPADARACCVLAHGAGAGMDHSFLDAVSSGLAAHGIATLRYQFPFMERDSRRTDPPALAHAVVRAAVDEARSRVPDLPLIAGGKSFGGRMTSQAQAFSPLLGVVGLAFLAFPLHPANRPSTDRAAHLAVVRIPMLFLAGSRDALADPDLLKAECDKLNERATLVTFEHADHAFPCRLAPDEMTIRYGAI